MSQTVLLNNTQLASELTVGYNSENGPQYKKATKEQIKLDPNAKGPAYRTLIYNGIGFTVSEETYQDWKAGKLAQMKLIQDTRVKKSIDPESGEEKEEKVTSYAYSGSMTKAAALSNKQYDVKMAQLDKVVSMEAASMTAEQVQALLTADL